jgi:hypothetical protein
MDALGSKPDVNEYVENPDCARGRITYQNGLSIPPAGQPTVVQNYAHLPQIGSEFVLSQRSQSASIPGPFVAIAPRQSELQQVQQQVPFAGSLIGKRRNIDPETGKPRRGRPKGSKNRPKIFRTAMAPTHSEAGPSNLQLQQSGDKTSEAVAKRARIESEECRGTTTTNLRSPSSSDPTNNNPDTVAGARSPDITWGVQSSQLAEVDDPANILRAQKEADEVRARRVTGKEGFGERNDNNRNGFATRADAFDYDMLEIQMEGLNRLNRIPELGPPVPLPRNISSTELARRATRIPITHLLREFNESRPQRHVDTSNVLDNPPMQTEMNHPTSENEILFPWLAPDEYTPVFLSRPAEENPD